MSDFTLEWFQEYTFDKDDAVHYKNTDVVSVSIGDKKVYVFRAGNNEKEIGDVQDDDLDYELIDSWQRRPMFHIAEFDGVYLGRDLYKTTSLRDAINYSKKYTEAQATL